MTEIAGLTSIPSQHNVVVTIDRLAAAVAAVGMAVLARIDHAASAEAAGFSLRPTELLLFGRPQGGTPLMQSRQTAGIDLPLKALAWEDADGRTWLGINDPAWIADRHGITGESAAAAVDALAAVLARVAATATA